MKTAFELEKEFVENTQEKTGRPLDHWMKALTSAGLSKMKESVGLLKNKHGVSHMNATFLAGIYLNDGQLVNDPKSLLKKHFEGKEDKKLWFEKLESMVKQSFESVQIVPTKGYISFRNPKEFAVAKINNKEMRLGLDLSDQPFDDYRQKAKSLGTMPRISHMIEITNDTQINEHLKHQLIKANKIVNN